ncbi:MAG: hypothetical protein GX159_11820 [Flavobacteriaceae bacterium]|jgi:hypothetical protein|nr:hypothetical protein [Flavobacteriaceae bacterium]
MKELDDVSNMLIYHLHGNGSSGFASGAVSSLISSGMQISGISGGQLNKFGQSDWYNAATIAAGGLSGGISSTIAGGSFWAGARQGLITSGLNHVAHKLAPDNGYRPDGNGGYEQVDTNGGDIIDYLYDENGNIVDRTLVYTMEYRTEIPNSSGTRTFGYKGIPKYSSVPQGGHALIDPTGDIVYGYAGGGLALKGLGVLARGTLMIEKFVYRSGGQSTFAFKWMNQSKSFMFRLERHNILSPANLGYRTHINLHNLTTGSNPHIFLNPRYWTYSSF